MAIAFTIILTKIYWFNWSKYVQALAKLEKRTHPPATQIPSSSLSSSSTLKSTPKSKPNSKLTSSTPLISAAQLNAAILSTRTSEYRFPEPLPSKNHRIAHTPKAKNATVTTAQQDLHNRKRRSSPQTAHLSPIDTKRPMYDLAAFLTPPLAGPIEEADELIDQSSIFIRTIINWNAERILDKSLIENRLQTHVSVVPMRSFEDVTLHERCVKSFSFSHTCVKLNKCHNSSYSWMHE